MKEKFRKIILIVSLLLLFVGAGYLVFYYVNEGKNDDVYDEVKEYTEEKEPEKEVEEPEEEPIQIPIDFIVFQRIGLASFHF